VWSKGGLLTATPNAGKNLLIPYLYKSCTEDNWLEYTRCEKKTQVAQEAKFLSRVHKPDMFFLLETMVNELNIKNILPLMGYDNSGGLAVLWNNGNIHALVLLKEPGLYTC